MTNKMAISLTTDLSYITLKLQVSSLNSAGCDFFKDFFCILFFLLRNNLPLSQNYPNIQLFVLSVTIAC